MDRWRGKIAVITGASAGIGAEITKALAGKGVIVVALARREDKLKELSVQCKGTVYGKVCDVTNGEEIIQAFTWVEKNLGGVDILINNAGVFFPTPLVSGSTSEWKKIIDTNIMGLCICTREALKTMRPRGDNGHIIHINSMSGHRVPKDLDIPFGMYAGSKHAVTAMAEALRIELEILQSNIKVTSISPGTVYTDMTKTMLSKMAEVISGSHSIPSFLESSDVTEAVLYALSTRPFVQVNELKILATGQKS